MRSMFISATVVLVQVASEVAVAAFTAQLRQGVIKGGFAPWQGTVDVQECVMELAG